MKLEMTSNTKEPERLQLQDRLERRPRAGRHGRGPRPGGGARARLRRHARDLLQGRLLPHRYRLAEGRV